MSDIEIFHPFDQTRITDSGVYGTVGSTLMRFPIIAAILFAATFAIGTPQSPFVGKWQTRVSRVTHKSAITVSIVDQERGLGGTVVLVNPDASEIQLPIVNVKITEHVIEFETDYENDTFYWNLTVQKNLNRGLLHGSCREMLIDERVRKH